MSVRFLKNLFPLEIADCQIDEGGNKPNIDGYIDFLQNDGTAYEQIFVQVKHLTYPEKDGSAFYDIPKSIYAYADRHKGDVILFIACDHDARKFYWRHIDSAAIDEYKKLSDHIQDSARYYFKPQEICSLSNLHETIDLWKKLYHDKMASIKDDRQLAENFATVQKASFSGVCSIFHGLDGSHIVREAVARLVALANDGSGKRIILLAGDAGVGKSVVMKDVMEQLSDSGTCVVAIKADTIDERCNPIALESIHNAIACFASGHRRIVLIIDQIDALSQSLSNDRNRLNTLLSILSKISDWPNVTAIVSCRKYDLEFDASLNLLKQESEVVELGLLSELEQTSVLQRLDSGLTETLDARTLELLRNAQYLNTFCFLHRNGRKKLSFKSPIDLYDALYESVVVAQTTFTAEELEDVMFDIAACVKSAETLKPVWRPAAARQRAFAYLASSGILVSEPPAVSFFHQTFYDYVLARLYVTRQESFISDLENEFQGLEVRSTVKAILEYYRGHDENKYAAEITKLLDSKRIRLHIKLLVVSLIATSERPRPCEKRILRAACKANRRLLVHFLRGAGAEVWFHTVLGLAAKVLPDAGRSDELSGPLVSCLARYSFKHPDEVFGSVHAIRDDSFRKEMVRFLLSAHNDYRNPTVTDAFDACRHDDAYAVVSRIKDALQSNVDFAFSRIERMLVEHLEADTTTRRNQGHDIVHNLCEDISSAHPHRFLTALHNAIAHAIKATAKEGVFGLSHTELFDSLRDSYDDELLTIYENLLTRHAGEYSTMMPLVNELLSLNNETAASMAFMAMAEHPGLYERIISGILSDSDRVETYMHGDACYFFMKMLRQRYAALTGIETAEYQRWVLAFRSQADMISSKERRWCRLIYPHLWWHKWLLICNTLPSEGLLPEMQRCRGELMRRFEREEIVRRQPHVVTMASIGGGIVSSEVNSRFTPGHWLRSFLKLPKDRWRHGDEQPFTVRAHASAFRKCVAKNPADFCALVLEIAGRDDINREYIIAGIEGLIDGDCDPDVLWPVASRFINTEFAKNDCHRFGKIVRFYLDKNDSYIDRILPILVDIMRMPLEKADTVRELQTLGNIASDMLNRAINAAQGVAMKEIIRLCERPEMRKHAYALIAENISAVDIPLLSLPLHYLHTKECYDGDSFFPLMKSILARLGAEALAIRGDAIQWCYYFKRDVVADYIDRIEHDKRSHHTLAQIYYYGLAHDNVVGDCRNRLERIIATDDEKTIATLVKIALETYHDTNYASIAKEYLKRFAADCREPVVHAFCVYSDRLPPEALDFYAGLSKTWPIHKHREAYEQLEYISKCVDSRPAKCLEFILSQKFTELDESMFVDEHVVKVLLMIYKKLKTAEDDELLDKIMDLFDEYLFRGNHVLSSATDKL